MTASTALAARDEHLPNIKQDCFDRQRVGGDPANECAPDFTVAIVTLDSHTGAVRALVGGPDFERDQFNIATLGKRQPGSSMQPIVLATLFEQGYPPLDQVRTDRPCSFDNPGGTPDPYEVDKSYRRGGGGIRSLAVATRQSNNCAFVRLGQIAGQDKVIEVSARLGIDTSAMAPEMSLPLGVFEVVPLEMAGAYSAFANDGIYNEPYYIERIEDRDGNVIYEHSPQGSRAVSSDTARMIAETLQGNVDLVGGFGTGRRAQIPGHAAAGKTGTTQSFGDAWFVGFTDYYTTAVWLGDRNERIRIEFPSWAGISSGRGGFGGDIPALIWGTYMGVLHEDLEPVAFGEPADYGGGRYLRAGGEVDFCSLGDAGNNTGPTQLVDSDNDGRPDCFVPVTTEPPEPEPEPGGDNGGGDNGGGNNGQPDGPTPPPITVTPGE